jgi:molybdate transport system substrate-binding protein
MRLLKEEWQKRTGQEVLLDVADSGQCLVKIENSGKGDLYVAHAPFPAAARKKGLAEGSYVVATLQPVIVVPRSNPKGIRELKDLARADLKVGLTDEKYSTLGYLAPLMLNKAGVRETVEGNIRERGTRQRSGGGVANEVVLGHLDAAIVWNAVAFLRKDKLDSVEIAPGLLPRRGVDTVTSATYGPIDMGKIDVEIQTLRNSRQPQAAREFAEFMASDDAAKVFQSQGFGPK